MRKYIYADIRRSVRRIPRSVILLLFWVGMLMLFWDAGKDQGFIYGSSLVEALYGEYFLTYALPIVIGIMEVSFLLSDDFKAKTAVGAIGYGISRREIVICKWIDIAVLSFFDVLLHLLMLLLYAALGQLYLGGGILQNLLCGFLMAWLKILLYTGFAIMAAYLTKSALLSILVYLMFSSTIMQNIASTLLDTKGIAMLHLNRFLPSAEIDTFYAQLLLGHFNVLALLVMFVYILGALAVAAYVFCGTELEF